MKSTTGAGPLRRIVKIIRDNERFLIAGHRSPDGDSLCSQLALAECLDALGKQSLVVSVDRAPERFAFLPGIERLVVTSSVDSAFDVAVLLECSDFARAGIANIQGRRTVNIDHHLQNSLYADVNWVDPKASAVGEMIFDLARALKVQVTPSMATNLYTSIVTDTGSFHYSNTTRRTFEVCARLLGTGISPPEIVRELYENEPLAKFQLLARILLSLERTAGGDVVWFSLTREEVLQCERDGIDTDGFVDFTRSIRGVRVVVFVREIGAEVYKVSLRSKDDTNVAELARHFGGGGHRNASGCVVRGARDQVLSAVLARLEPLMRPA